MPIRCVCMIVWIISAEICHSNQFHPNWNIMVKDYEIQMSIHVKCMHGFHAVSIMFPLKVNPFFHPVLHTFYFIQIYDMIIDLVLFLGFFLNWDQQLCIFKSLLLLPNRWSNIRVHFRCNGWNVSHVAKFAGCNAIFFIYRPVSFVTFLFDVHIRILKSCQRAS